MNNVIILISFLIEEVVHYREENCLMEWANLQKVNIVNGALRWPECKLERYIATLLAWKGIISMGGAIANECNNCKKSSIYSRTILYDERFIKFFLEINLE